MKRSITCDEVFGAIARAGGLRTIELAARLNCSLSVVHNRLRLLFDDGLIMRRTRWLGGKGRHTFVYYPELTKRASELAEQAESEEAVTIESFTNSLLTCAGRCPRELDLRYVHQLARAGEDREVLAVGSTWHAAHDVATKNAHDPRAPFDAIEKHAPGELWREKLGRLYSGYQWRWKASPLPLVASETKFDVKFATVAREEGGCEVERARGQIDGVLNLDGRMGILERKTSGEDIDDGAPYWDRLRMDTQLSFYALAFRELTGASPEFIVYDVVRKPTIRPKGIAKKDALRLRLEVERNGVATYYGDAFAKEEIDAALAHDLETSRMYGARLTADIGERPDFYYQRRIVARTEQDLAGAHADAMSKIAMVRWLEERGRPFPRNPNACNVFGLCDFFGLCSNNEYPTDGRVPDGFVRRDNLHPELDDEQ